MPRRPRIEIAGYYHVINRGVEQRVIFKEKEDYKKFEELLCTYAPSYGGKVLGLSQPTVSGIVKRGNSTITIT